MERDALLPLLQVGDRGAADSNLIGQVLLSPISFPVSADVVPNHPVEEINHIFFVHIHNLVTGLRSVKGTDPRVPLIYVTHADLTAITSDVTVVDERVSDAVVHLGRREVHWTGKKSSTAPVGNGAPTGRAPE